MKIHNFFKLFFTVLVLFGVGCQKDVQDEDLGTQKLRLISHSTQTSDPNNPLNHTSIIYNGDGTLSKLDKGPSSNLNIVFEYDTKDRLVRGGDQTYRYNASDQIDTIIFSDIDTAAVTYYLNGYIKQIDYVRNTVYGAPRFYSQERIYDEQNRPFHIIRTEIFENHDESTTTTLYYDERDNVIKMFYNWRDSWTGTYLQNETTYTYDNKKNPFYYVFKATGFSENPSLIYLYSLPSLGVDLGCDFYSPNNLISAETVGPDGSYFVFSTDYVYNEEGFPISSLMTYAQYGSDGNKDVSFTEDTTWEYESNPFKN